METVSIQKITNIIKDILEKENFECKSFTYVSDVPAYYAKTYVTSNISIDIDDIVTFNIILKDTDDENEFSFYMRYFIKNYILDIFDIDKSIIHINNVDEIRHIILSTIQQLRKSYNEAQFAIESIMRKSNMVQEMSSILLKDKHIHI